MAETYDSRQDTRDHIVVVREILRVVRENLRERAMRHDLSKLESPEKELFDAARLRLWELTYDSEEYRAQSGELKEALDHHYAANGHHPEHYPDGIRGMSLLDVIEMFCDWKAATIRHADGDIRRSIDINQGRFGYSDEMRQILLNTAAELKF